MASLNIVLHAHSEWSYDGSWTLSAIARLFGALGVDVVMMTEHDDGFSESRFTAYRAACAEASTPRCTLVPGIEYSSPENDIHLLTWGFGGFLGEHRPVAATLRDVASEGGVAIFAHPARRDAWRSYDDAWTPLLHGVELWNRKTDGVAPGEQGLALMRRTGLPGLAGVDFHRINQLYPLDHRLEIGGAASSGDIGETVIAAIRAGTLTPRVFRRPLIADSDFSLHRRAELLRRGARRLLRR